MRPERVDAGARLRGDDVDDGDQRRELAREALFNCLERRHNIASRRAVALREHDRVRDAERVEGVIGGRSTTRCSSLAILARDPKPQYSPNMRRSSRRTPSHKFRFDGAQAAPFPGSGDASMTSSIS